MTKKNMKVDLERYMSPEEKIKRSFIFSCTILVILTFVIFITYSFFIDNTGEINVGNTYVETPSNYVEIINEELVDNTNGQQAIITIINNSNEDTYSYSLGSIVNNSGACNEVNVYYKIPSDEYSHPEGIIKPNEMKKIYLVSNRICWGTETLINYVDLNLYSGYEYMPPMMDDSYAKIEYSPLSSSTELINLTPSIGYLSPSFNEYTYDYDLYFSYNDYMPGGAISFTTDLTNGGYITSSYDPINGYILSSISTYETWPITVYAEDGTNINTYTIHTGVAAVSELLIQQVTSSSSSTTKFSGPLSSCGPGNGESNCNIGNFNSSYQTKLIFTFANPNFVNRRDFSIALINGSSQSPSCRTFSPDNNGRFTLTLSPGTINVGVDNNLYIYLCNGESVDLMLSKYTLRFN